MTVRDPQDDKKHTKKNGGHRLGWKDNLLASSATVPIVLVLALFMAGLFIGPFLGGPFIVLLVVGAALGLVIGMLFGPFLPHAVRRLRSPEKRKPIRTWHRVTGVILLALATMIGLIVADFMRVYYRVETARRFYEVGVSFSAEGRDFEHTAIIEIRPYARYPDHRIQYKQLTHRMGMRLPSGAAVLFPVPSKNDLARLAQAQGEAGASIVHFLPVAYWLDDTDDPSMIESYVSEAYYEQPSPRIRIHSFSVNRLAEGVPLGQREGAGSTAKFFGVYADVVFKSEWEKDPEVAAIVGGISEPQVLTKEDSAKISERFLNCGAADKHVPQTEGALWTSDACIAASRRLRAVRRQGSRFELALDEPGVIADYRNFTVPDQIELDINGHSLPVSARTWLWQFDPKTQLLLAFREHRAFLSETTLKSLD